MERPRSLSLSLSSSLPYSDQWPPGRPIPEYHIEFTDGCIPSNLHNASDCPANFPTLDTLPREQRGPNYSDAYDGDLADGESSGLLINPAVMQAVASKAAMVSTPILPGSAPRRPVSTLNVADKILITVGRVLITWFNDCALDKSGQIANQ